MKKLTLQLDEKQLCYLVLALETYVRELQEDADDPGPSMMDAIYVSHLLEEIRREIPKLSGQPAAITPPGS